MGFVGNLPGFQQRKNFENPLRIDKVIAMSLLYYFFGTQCSYYGCFTDTRILHGCWQ